jgi:hypothetical protein
MIRQSSSASRPNRPANRKTSPFSKQSLAHAFRVIAPTLVALTFASAAHAQGTMDFSGAQTLMGTFKTFAIYAGAVICFGGLIFAGIRMMSGRFQDAIPGLFGALFGAGVLGWGAGWIGSLTGQNM